MQKGDVVLLSLSRSKVRPGSYLEKEIKYLMDNGYKFVDDITLKK
ncbi:hypothetical protein [Aequorivita ciconiae]|nr:hypothetical protein [Aequorivita sp. H23M31]